MAIYASMDVDVQTMNETRAVYAYRVMLPDVRRCMTCAQPLPPTPPRGFTGGTGYGTREKSDVYGPSGDFCYPCAAVADRREMCLKGRIVLYLSDPHLNGKPTGNLAIVNWPGSLIIRVSSYKRSKGFGFGGSYGRVDVRFTGPDGEPWYGVHQGNNNTLIYCKRAKRFRTRTKPGRGY